MNYNKNIILIILLLSYSSFSYGENRLSVCTPTKAYFDNYEPKIFPTSNNLLRKPGQYPITCGEKMLIKGKVVDKNCVPVSDAKVYVWQTACDGKYPYKPLRHVYKKNDINLTSGATFTGAGQTVTDNKGEFYFITTYPGSFHGKKPYIDFRVNHPLLGSFDSRFFVTKHEQQEIDHNFATPRYDIEGSLVNHVQIVYRKAHPLKEY